jgi:hypothetical protein
MNISVPEIIIDEEFKYLLLELDQETYRLLEENILEHGCRDPLALWNGILVDGYNRYNICTTHDIPFKTINKDFASRDEVLIWIITNQISRRNLTPIQLGHFRGLHYQADKKIKATNQYTAKSAGTEILHPQNNEVQTGRTAVRLAEHYGVSHDTIQRDAKLAKAINSIGEISPETKRKILSGEIAVSRTKLENLNLASKEEIEKLNVIISSFASNFNSMLKKWIPMVRQT